MNEVLIDTDIIIDLVSNRESFAKYAVELFSLMEQKKVNGYTSSLTFSNLYYVLKRHAKHGKVISVLDTLSQIIGILKVDENTIRNALKSGFIDFEDSIQYQAALESKRVGVIITRNLRDFKKSQIPVLTPQDFLKSFDSK